MSIDKDSNPPHSMISRRKLLASIGMAGAVMASESVLGGAGLINKASAATVTTYAVQNIANLKTISASGLAANQLAFVQGYYSPNDEGGGQFYWDAASTATDNGATVIVPSGYSGTGRWRRIMTP